MCCPGLTIRATCTHYVLNGSGGEPEVVDVQLREGDAFEGNGVGFVDGDGAVVDHSTRQLLCLSRPVNCTSWVLLGYLFFAIGRYGKPKAVRTDNASAFTSRLFGFMLRLVGIVHQRTELGYPWQSGRIERLFRTLKEKLDRIEVSTPKELTGLLSEFCFWHNEVRPHQNLYGLTPYEVWHHIDPYGKALWRTSWYSGWSGLLTGFVHRR